MVQEIGSQIRSSKTNILTKCDQCGATDYNKPIIDIDGQTKLCCDQCRRRIFTRKNQIAKKL